MRLPYPAPAVGYVGQHDEIWDFVTGLAFVSIYAALRGASNADALDALARVGLTESNGRDVSRETVAGYSGGERRRLAIAGEPPPPPLPLLLSNLTLLRPSQPPSWDPQSFSCWTSRPPAWTCPPAGASGT